MLIEGIEIMDEDERKKVVELDKEKMVIIG